MQIQKTQEWQNSTSPLEMLELLPLRNNQIKRKLRLFTVVCFRKALQLLQLDMSAWQNVIEAIEEFADGHISANALSKVNNRLWNTPWVAYITGTAWRITSNSAIYGATDITTRITRIIEDNRILDVATATSTDKKQEIEKALQVSLLHDLFAVFPSHRRGAYSQTIIQLARAAYDDRDPITGYLDSSRLSVLADALDDENKAPELSAHFRDRACPCSFPHTPHDTCDGSVFAPKVHIRGCQALDLILRTGQ